MDITAKIVKAHLNAFREPDGFDLRIHPNDGGSTLVRRWAAGQVLTNLSFLKARNANGCDIWIRPARDNTPWILLDDLNAQTVDWLRVHRLTPGIVVETSPKNFQAWLRLSDGPVQPTVKQAVLEKLQTLVNSDPGAARFQQVGRLAGFTNPKKGKHRMPDGRFPFARLRTATGGTIESSSAVLARGRELARATPRTTVLPAKVSNASGQFADLQTAMAAWAEADAGLTRRYGAIEPGNGTQSSRDYGIARALVRRGFPVNVVADTIVACSPNIQARHPDAADYARYTAEKAAGQHGKAHQR